MAIVWREQMSVGNDIIDRDHKYLICLMNSIELALKHDDTLELLPVFTGQLVSYTEEHFAREEDIQKKAQYPLANEHKREHANLIQKLGELSHIVEDFIDKKTKDELDLEEETELNQKILALARQWILEHVIKEDKRMEHYLRKLPQNFC